MEIYAQISVKTGCGVSSGIFPPFFTREQKWWFWHDRKQNHATPSKLCAQFWISPQSYLRIYFQIFYYLRPSFWWHIVENYAREQQTWKMKIRSWNVASREGDTVCDVIFAGCFLSRRDVNPTRVKKNVVLNLSTKSFSREWKSYALSIDWMKHSNDGMCQHFFFVDSNFKHIFIFIFFSLACTNIL